MTRVRLTVLVALGLGAACMDSEPTGLELTVRFAEPMQIDRVRVAATSNGEPAFEPGIVPEEPRPIEDGEVALVLVPDELAGAVLELEIEGMEGSTVVARGENTTQVVLGAVTPVAVMLAPVDDGGGGGGGDDGDGGGGDGDDGDGDDGDGDDGDDDDDDDDDDGGPCNNPGRGPPKCDDG